MISLENIAAQSIEEAINRYGLDACDFFNRLSHSDYSRLYETLDITMFSQHSSTDIARYIVEELYEEIIEPLPTENVYNRTAEYWAAEVIIRLSRKYSFSFADIFSHISPKELIVRFYPGHEIPIDEFVDSLYEEMSYCE